MRTRGKPLRPDLGMRSHGFWYLFVDLILIYCILGCAFICLRVYMRACVCVCVRAHARVYNSDRTVLTYIVEVGVVKSVDFCRCLIPPEPQKSESLFQCFTESVDEVRWGTGPLLLSHSTKITP